MPELPEIEVLTRHLRPVLCGKIIRAVHVHRERVVRPTSSRMLRHVLTGAKFVGLSRRGKYLLFRLRLKSKSLPVTLLGHLGMSGRMFLARNNERLPKHAAVILGLGKENFIYEDTRYFGRFTLDTTAIKKLGPEPLKPEFSLPKFAAALKKSRQTIKIKLLDQALVAGIGNIYASEALYHAHISPMLAANQLTPVQVKRLRHAIRQVLADAIHCGSTMPLNFGGRKTDRLFYFGHTSNAEAFYEERLRVYDRAGKPCQICGRPIRRITQAARSTFYCPHCQKA